MNTTTMNPTHANGRRRPSLGEQINRLDSMLDGLSEALNEAVADAVKVGVNAAVKEAVQAVLTEVLTNPEIRARLIPAAPIAKEVSHPQPAGGWWRRVHACIHAIRTECRDILDSGGVLVGYFRDAVQAQCVAAWEHCGMLWPFKFQILFALTIGACVGGGVAYGEPWIAAVTSGIGGFVTTLTVQTGLWLRRLLSHDERRIA